MAAMTPWDRSAYPPEWEAIRLRLLRRAKNACEWCGARNHEPHPKTKSEVVLTMAHIYDRRPEAVDPRNLKMLCQRCHNRLDRPMRNRPAGAKATGRGEQVLLNGKSPFHFKPK